MVKVMKGSVRINQIYLRHLSLAEAKQKLVQELTRAYQNGDLVNVIIHGQGHESEGAPVIKEFVRNFLESSEFARRYVYAVYPGETGSPFTAVNPGETVVIVKAVRGDTAARLAGLKHDLAWVAAWQREEGQTVRQGEHRHAYGYEGRHGDGQLAAEDDLLDWKSKYDDYEEELEERESRRSRRAGKAGRSRPKDRSDW
ncbi:MAG: Smr/MutS family protein [Limnochordales bacterium]|nr:Smr/MutS family protein [Limnochordales bacterium]